MRLSPKAAAQMYPHLTSVECAKHNEQPRGKVPPHLKGVFANRENPEFVCSACLKEAKQEWDDQQRSLRRTKEQQRQDRREYIKKTREKAKEADKVLAHYIHACSAAEEAVNSAEQVLASTRSTIREKQEKHNSLMNKVRKLVGQADTLEAEILRISEESLDQFEALTEADNEVTECYNALQNALDEADHLWESLGKSTKKKRDKSRRKDAQEKLKAFYDKRQPTDKDDDNGSS